MSKFNVALNRVLSEHAKVKMLPLGELSLLWYTRNTNATPYFKQHKGSCYAHASVSAYLNTCLRIYNPSKPIPTYAECLKIADYTDGNGGEVSEAIHRLERHFNFGVQCQDYHRREIPPIRDMAVSSLVISFWTSKKGWDDVANGSLISKAGGDIDPIGHSVLGETYLFEDDCYECKNSWGDDNVEPRFKLRLEAAHDFLCTNVYFTESSISGKTRSAFIPIMSAQFISTLADDWEIKAVLVDELTATYCSEWVCTRYSNNWYIGYDVDRYVHICLRNKRGYTDKKIIGVESMSRQAPDILRMAGRGLTVEGVCRNPHCTAYNSRVFCMHGYGVYMADTDESACPACAEAVDPARPLCRLARVVCRGHRGNGSRFKSTPVEYGALKPCDFSSEGKLEFKLLCLEVMEL